MRCTGYEMARYKGTQASHLYEKSMHTLCTIQWATAPGRSLNYPRPKSITHLRTFSDNGGYVALQLFLVILVSDQQKLMITLKIAGKFILDSYTVRLLSLICTHKPKWIIVNNVILAIENVILKPISPLYLKYESMQSSVTLLWPLRPSM